MTFEERYKELNAKQRLAVDTIDGPLLVVAGPGSGKTEILALRVGKILTESQVLASNILCLTFTESASSNMRNRLSGLIGSEAYRVAIHTFHNFCVEIIQKYPEYFYGGAFFSPADTLAQIQILQDIFESLPQKNPLSSLHPEQGFVYLLDVSKIIGYLKKNGLQPEEFKKILKHNESILPEINGIIGDIFKDRLSKATIEKAIKGADKLLFLAEKNKKSFPSAYWDNLYHSIGTTLKKAANEAGDLDKVTPLTEWKEKWLKKNDDNENIFKDTAQIEKLLALADVYADYRKIMHEKGYFDFDDMILDCLDVLEENPSLRYEIQEQYQYLLVDEFQDTNGAQMRLLRCITDAPVHEGKPNIMAVGDDDQAVYKFQGAELSNILNFKKAFTDVQIVTMTNNYRSTQDILDIASNIIRKGTERLEKLLPEIEKNLVASNKNIKGGEIRHKEFQTIAHEYHFVSREIKKRIEAGEDPESIAVIGRKHYQLEALVPYLQGVGIAIRYEREQNVFREPHIAELILISRFLISLADKQKEEADEYLPQILSFPFWNLERETVWNISLLAKRDELSPRGIGRTWLEIMCTSADKRVQTIARFLIALGVRSQSEPLEKILDAMVGSHLAISAENEDDDFEEALLKKNGEFISPFKQYYFSKEKFDHARAEYLSFLSSLRVFVSALREYKNGEILSLKDLVEFVDLHEKNDVSLNDQSPFARLTGAISLLTAHKAKGLEFETVFVLSCQDDVWAGRGIPSKISLPANLPIKPAGDTEDDQLRLFYVAITRAKRHLYLTSYQTKENGKEAQKLRFLIAKEEDENLVKGALKKLYSPEAADALEDAPEAHEVLTASWLDYHTPPFMGSEKKILETLLHEYKMPVTHLGNFLNIEKGGPQYFLEQNLLRFPSSKTVSGSYGTAIHETLEQLVLYFKNEGALPNTKAVLSWFSTFLRKERLSSKDFAGWNERGQEALTAFLEKKKGTFSQKDIVEFNFKEQGVVINGAYISGKIDRIVAGEHNTLEVHDYKTGKAPKNEWMGHDAYEKTKLHRNEQQLIFYKILVEHSREFAHKYKVEKGVLEFVEPTASGKIITLNLEISREKTERLERLIGKVYAKIMNLNFPDISRYSPDLKGIEKFEEDLLEDRI